MLHTAVHNFNSGPSILPKEVFEQASQAVLNFNNTGLSILEIGHRTPAFTAVIEEAVALVKEIGNLDADHEVLFLHGGASTQFLQVPMNLLDQKETAAFAETGHWAHKAQLEAQQFGRTEIACSSREKNFTYIPKDFAVPNDAKYFHITTNNTIYGTQWHKIPDLSNVIVADMSSDIFSRPLDFNRFGLIYAGAQKNIGAAGVTLAIVNKNILGKTKRTIPTMLDYRNHITNKSVLNTPPVFAIYTSLLTLRWLKAQGGLIAVEKQNAAKAKLLYDEIDRNTLFTGTVEAEDRSFMNVCFVMNDSSKEEAFLALAKQRGMVGIKGYRTVGGFRASLYNALPESSVRALIDVMQEFERYV